jgi:hypothetical protein
VIRSAVIDSTHAYRREARRLRWHYANRPAELYNSLRQLSARQDRKQQINGSDAGADVLSVRERNVEISGDSRRFAQIVAGELEQGVLRFSARQRLLSTAERMGIGRFQANLVIAAVQHQLGATTSEPRQPHFSWASRLLAAVLLQGLIVASIYLFFLSH